ncbi:polynucleotide kinase 3 phosphatase [Phlyctema vagabunda]|uniref:Polynucleotide kinase 3 phosphatase n=1 Tax=Phlyctema vagabunda TaxID=108571 RepID=A0ABR4PWK5_9HELO
MHELYLAANVPYEDHTTALQILQGFCGANPESSTQRRLIWEGPRSRTLKGIPTAFIARQSPPKALLWKFLHDQLLRQSYCITLVYDVKKDAFSKSNEPGPSIDCDAVPGTLSWRDIADPVGARPVNSRLALDIPEERGLCSNLRALDHRFIKEFFQECFQFIYGDVIFNLSRYLELPQDSQSVESNVAQKPRDVLPPFESLHPYDSEDKWVLTASVEVQNGSDQSQLQQAIEQLMHVKTEFAGCFDFKVIDRNRSTVLTMSSHGEKRKAGPDRSISPPPLRKKLHSSTTKNAISSFFTPTSQKPPEKMTWHERGPNDDVPSTLLVGTYQPSDSTYISRSVPSTPTTKEKIAAFDFDSTLITTSSGKVFASDAHDWKWWHPSVPSILQKLYSEDGYKVVVLSNQGAISLSSSDKKGPKIGKQSKLEIFKAKASAVFNQLDIPITIYAATEKDIYRKPRTGMWEELLADYNIGKPDELNLPDSIFVGDAAGRPAVPKRSKDFSCSDRNFADNVGIAFFTPEEYFLKEDPRSFTRPFDPSEHLADGSTASQSVFARKNDRDIVLFCGSPGAGKSTFYWKYLQPLDYARVNQDTLKTRDKCIKVAAELLAEGSSVVVDNTNADTDVRSKWIELAKKYGVPIRCVLFTAGTALCQHNDAVRALNVGVSSLVHLILEFPNKNLAGDRSVEVAQKSHKADCMQMNPEKRTILPSIAFSSFASKFRKPSLSEGFQDITEVDFRFQGDEAEERIWTRHWN